VAAGASLASISARPGCTRTGCAATWPPSDPATAAAVAETELEPVRHDARWLPSLQALGFADVRSYLVERHVVDTWTVHSIAREIGMSPGTVQSALDRHGVARVPHAASRSRCAERAAAVAARFGYADIGGYLDARRAAGLSRRSIAAECGESATWLAPPRRPAQLTRRSGPGPWRWSVPGGTVLDVVQEPQCRAGALAAAR